MSYKFVFVDRRSDNRRQERDPCKKMPMDLYHRKRRKSVERRDTGKTLTDDYYSFLESKEDKGLELANKEKDPAKKNKTVAQNNLGSRLN